MRILFLTQVLPYPLDAGPKVRAYYVLRHLAENHSVTLVSFVRDSDTPEAEAHLRRYCESVHPVPIFRSRFLDAFYALKSMVTQEPFLITRDWVHDMADKIGDVVRDEGPFDAIHADQLWMAPYAVWASKVAASAYRRPRIVLDQHNAVFLIPKRMAQGETNLLKRVFLAAETRKLARYEVETCRLFDHVVWVTQEDYEAIRVQARETAQTIPNSATIPICADPEATAPIARAPNTKRVTFLGGLHYPPNAQGVLWFAKNVFPAVLAHAVLTVLGKDPPGELSELRIPAQNLDVTGYVDDPTPYLQETGAFVVPLLSGGGMRVKIVDGWTWGLPIVSTTVGAEGTAIRPGQNILIADRPDEFAAAVTCVLQDPQLQESLAEQGRQTAIMHYSWRTVYQRWNDIYQPVKTDQ